MCVGGPRPPGPPPPSAFKCKQNYLPVNEGASVASPSVNSRAECEAACRSSAKCNAFAWQRDTRRCHTKSGFNLATAGTQSCANCKKYDFCYHDAAPATTPTTTASGVESECADQNGVCKCDGQVRYGDKASGRWSRSAKVSGSIACDDNNAYFGDPAPGVLKSCYCTPDPRQRPAGVEFECTDQKHSQNTWSDGVCKCDGQVRYGDKASGRWSEPTKVSGSIVCDLQPHFGDPAPGAWKKCYCTPKAASTKLEHKLLGRCHIFPFQMGTLTARERHTQGKMPNKECEAKWGQQGNRLGGLMGIALYTLNAGLDTQVGGTDQTTLTECQSNCKSDNDCAAGHKCMVRISPSDTVPGCKLPAKFDTTTGCVLRALGLAAVPCCLGVHCPSHPASLGTFVHWSVFCGAT